MDRIMEYKPLHLICETCGAKHRDVTDHVCLVAKAIRAAMLDERKRLATIVLRCIPDPYVARALAAAIEAEE